MDTNKTCAFFCMSNACHKSNSVHLFKLKLGGRVLATTKRKMHKYDDDEPGCGKKSQFTIEMK